MVHDWVREAILHGGARILTKSMYIVAASCEGVLPCSQVNRLTTKGTTIGVFPTRRFRIVGKKSRVQHGYNFRTEELAGPINEYNTVILMNDDGKIVASKSVRPFKILERSTLTLNFRFSVEPF